MAKKIQEYLKIQVPAGNASPSPPIGPALGQRGLNIMDFCRAFNAESQNIERGSPVPCTITIYSDKSFTFKINSPPTSYLLKKAANLKSGSKEPGRLISGSITQDQLREVAKVKIKDLNANSIDQAILIIEGSARSMGLEIEV
ncbi:50S ribosomal protein L11 [Candidatus Endowatersipora endosymbiont of Watersipora subatra]|uniref:50S ribosomal protein L11 n=1 Tax=Candidatus Endowatersipora endosymbiont of Watersipora subatra TaxID=3077946 RepID=UPI00312CA11D